MPGRVYEGDLTVPAGTPVAAPVSAVLNLPVGTVAKLTLVIPPGHAGLTGIQVLLAGTPIVPYSGAAFISGDGYTDSWDIDQDVNPGQFVLAGYNLDVFPHKFFVRVLWQSAPPPPTVSGVVASSSAAGLDLSQLGQTASDQGASGVPAASLPSGAAGTCYDISGNVVDCADQSAVSGPVTYAAAPSSSTPAGALPATGTGADTCYDANGYVVDCADPAAVSGPVVPSVPAVAQPAGAPSSGTARQSAPPPRRPAHPPADREPEEKPRPAARGPYRHIATGKQSLDTIARERHTTAGYLIGVTRGAEGMNRAELTAFNHYVSSGTGKAMHKGLAYYTTAP